MKDVLNEIQSGQFAKEWVENYRKDSKTAFAKLLEEVDNHEIEKVGRDLRKMMWPKRNKLKNIIGLFFLILFCMCSMMT